MYALRHPNGFYMDNSGAFTLDKLYINQYKEFETIGIAKQEIKEVMKFAKEYNINPGENISILSIEIKCTVTLVN